MGCLQSKKESSDLHPNIFRVVNIDENGADLCSGQLEITESDIVLYREGRDSTIWPLHSLRRYGFEGDIFSFESGRRCETGEGIYAFRCRRASLLFRTLQQRIQLRNVIHESVTYPVSRLTPSPQSRQTLQASVVHRSSIDNGQVVNLRPNINSNLPGIIPFSGVLRNETQSPRSPSSADILEVMPLYPREQVNTNHITNVYQLRDLKREHNNNESEGSDSRHVYSNDFSRDLAILRSTLHKEHALNTMRDIEDENLFLENRYMNDISCAKENKDPLSPTMSNGSEHYAQLSLEQQEVARLYMNVVPSEVNPETNYSDAIPTTPLTPIQVDYCNLAIGSKSDVNTYANLSLGELGDSTKNVKHTLGLAGYSEHNQKFSESDPFTSLSPVEELEVNYAILDIDSNKEGVKVPKDTICVDDNSGSLENNIVGTVKLRSCLKSQCSMEKPVVAGSSNVANSANIGYTTIDFDKTVALTSVAAGGDIDVEGPRKTRHNSCNIVCGSPSTGDKNKLNNN